MVEQLNAVLAEIGEDVKQLQILAKKLPLVGIGRPDQPSTTAGVISGNEPNGTQFRSIDGANVGAWLWEKRNGSWLVIEGDTGWRRIDSPALSSGYLVLRRTANANYLCGTGGSWGTVSIASNAQTQEAGRKIHILDYGRLPEGWRTPVAIVGQVTRDGYDPAGFLLVSSTDDANHISLRSPTNERNYLRFPMLVYPPSDAWCSRLPGEAVRL